MQRNYRFFFMFVSSTMVICVYVFAFCWIYIRRIMESEDTSIWKAMIKTPASIVLIIYTFISMWFVGGLTAFHLYLISTNQVRNFLFNQYALNIICLSKCIYNLIFDLFSLQTTYENFRYRYDRRANPYNKGVLNNFKEIFCTSIPASKNNLRSMVPNEPALPSRSVGGGFMNQSMGKAGEDIEMGRKAVWEMGSGIDDSEVNASNDRTTIKDGELSPEIRTTVDETGDRIGMHPRRSSWGRKSGNWEMSPEVLALAARVGEPNRPYEGNSSHV